MIENGSNFQSQKVLAVRKGTEIHSTQFAIIFNNELLVQCDVIISGSNVRLRATPESGISGTTSFRVRREVT